MKKQALESLQNQIAFQSSTSSWWKNEDSIPVAISNVFVGSLGDYGPMSNVVDIGPHLDAAFAYPEAGQSNEATYQVDYTNVFYQLVIPDIWINPIEAFACVGDTNPVQFTVYGTNIPNGVTWTIYQTNFAGHAVLQTNVNWHLAEVTPGNVATNYKIRAMSVDNPNFYDEVSLTVLKVEMGNLPDVYLEVTYSGESEESIRTVEPVVTPNTQAVRNLLTFESSDTDEATVSYNSTQNKLTIIGVAKSTSQEDVTIIAKFSGTELDTDSISVLEATSVSLISGAGSGNCTDSHPPPERVEWPIVWQVNDQFEYPFTCVGLEIYENIRRTDLNWNPIEDWWGWTDLDVTEENGRFDDLHAAESSTCLDDFSDFYNLQKFSVNEGERELSPIFKEKIETSCSSGTETITE